MDAGDINGDAAVACVGGTVLALLATAGLIAAYRAGVLWRVRRERAPHHGDYSTPEAAVLDQSLTALEQYARSLGFQLAMLLLAAASTALLYSGLWYELLRGDPPSIGPNVFFWFALIDGSVILGATISAWSERPGHSGRRPAS